MLKGTKIILRPLEAGDLEKTLLWRNHLAIREAAMAHPFPVTRDQEKNWFDHVLNSKDNNTIYFAIVRAVDGEFAGYLFLNRINWISRTCYFSIYIGEEINQGKGYGSESLQLILEYAFQVLNLRKVLLEVNASNKAAITLYERTGFVVEGTLREQFFIRGQYIDSLVMGIFHP
ncbi:MAG: GNAT family protein [Bacteroidetes bacterium]|nr:GNAT family protein [Bacteroidota bacterium]